LEQRLSHADATTTPKTGRKPYVKTGRPVGRPKGSRNKPKPPEAQVPTVQPRYLQIANACRYADVSVTTMRRWIRQGHVRSVHIGAVVLVSITSLDELEGRRV
jgi:excisionase family DNA binding protein